MHTYPSLYLSPFPPHPPHTHLTTHVSHVSNRYFLFFIFCFLPIHAHAYISLALLCRPPLTHLMACVSQEVIPDTVPENHSVPPCFFFKSSCRKPLGSAPAAAQSPSFEANPTPQTLNPKPSPACIALNCEGSHPTP